MASYLLERARGLFAEGRFRAALDLFGENIPDDPSLALSCSEALIELAQHDRALAIATAIQHRHSGNSTLLSGARRIAGTVAVERGERSAATEHFKAAISLAEAAGEHGEAARAALRLFTCAHNASGPIDSADALLAAKRLVLRSNQPRLLADLHSRVGQAEAQSSNLRAANTHLSRAVEILRDHNHFGIFARTKLALSSTLALLCRNDAATTEAKEALKAAELAGSLGLTRLCRANVAQLQFRTASFESARRNAKELLESPELPDLFRLAVLETYVATLFELSECDTGLLEIEEFLSVMAEPGNRSWVAVEAVPTQARVLDLLRGRGAAFEALALGRASSTQRDHADSTCRLSLIEAELRLREADVHGGERLINEATAIIEGQPSLELVGLLERCRGLNAALRGYRSAARMHLDRSERVLRGCGLRTEARRTRRLRRDAAATTFVHPNRSDRRSQEGLSAASDPAFLASLSSHPRLLASELANAAARLRLSERADIVVGPLPSTRTRDGRAISIACGREAEGQITLELYAPSDYLAQERLSTLTHVVSESVQLAAVDRQRNYLAEFFEMDVALDSKRGVYVSAPMRSLLSQIRQVARTELPVLVRGETGTGKEIVAEEVHALSARAHGPFVPLNVTAVPREMLEGQLFGYRRGAFTGAVSDARGLIREAEGGTLFIDEIGDLSPDLQPKLLRFLESGEIQPLGERPQRVDVRIVAATNARLDQLVKEGRFRDDLFYRLNVVSLTIPPLRDRREEIPTLINHFLTQHARDAGKLIPQLSPHALERLSAYDWPGNVRQLTNELKRIVALHDENALIEVEHLSDVIRQPPAATPASTTIPADAALVSVRLDQTLQAMYDDVERAAIPRALRLSRNNQSETAQRLGITRKGLYLKRRRLGLGEESA